MWRELRPAFVILAALSVLTGIAYPLLVTVIAKAAFPRQASGSLIEEDGIPRGSELVGQAFDDARYFWSRPSATAPVPYNALASSGSNLGPTNPATEQAIQTRIARLRAFHGEDRPIPVDLVTASGSGLDPHISPAAARFQVERVAGARGLDAQRVGTLVEEHVEARTFGLLGEPRVNVLRLNLALDRAR